MNKLVEILNALVRLLSVIRCKSNCCHSECNSRDNRSVVEP